MRSAFWDGSGDATLDELRRTDQVLAGIQQMLKCQRRGLCLLHEWFRRYGTAGASCRCHQRVSEHLAEYDFPPDDQDASGPQL